MTETELVLKLATSHVINWIKQYYNPLTKVNNLFQRKVKKHSLANLLHSRMFELVVNILS